MRHFLPAMEGTSWPKPGGLAKRLRRLGTGDRLAVVLAGAALLSGVVTFALLTGRPATGADARSVLILLNVNLVLLLVLVAFVARRLVQVIGARRQESAGSRLHVRFVAVLSAVAVTPAIVVAVFAILFLNYGVDSWFSERVRDALGNAENVARAYLDEHKEVIRADALAMAADLNREGPILIDRPELFQRLVETQALLRSLTEAVVFQSNGDVLARTGLTFVLGFQDLPPRLLEQAARGELVTLTSDTDDRVRALLRLDGFVDAYLFVGRFVDPVVLRHMANTERLGSEYELMAAERSGIQITFALLFGVVALLLLLAAVWVGLTFANRLMTPISRLIVAADRVSGGDLTARVPVPGRSDELASLSLAFNRMTGELAGQRQALVEANEQIDARRRFTEAVLSDVSSSVLGLDRRGRVTLANPSAAAFFDQPAAGLVGQPLIALLPELAGMLTRLAATGEGAVVEQIDVAREGQTRTLLVRASPQAGDDRLAGFVITFDDLSDLLAAQRKAAWSEIARRIAHEIKNPLTPIQLSAERLRRRFLQEIKGDPETFAGCTDTIVRQVEAIRRLIDEFSAFARMPQPVFSEQSAVQLVRQAVTMQQVAHPEVTFVKALPEMDVRIHCDPHQVAQALINLLQNAIEAVRARHGAGPGHGRIEVRLRADGEHCVLDVLDDGPGLPPEIRDRLTQPYVTGRKDGTGLGLAIVDKIMEQHGGSLTVADRAEGGACARLVFPVASVRRAAAG